MNRARRACPSETDRATGVEPVGDVARTLRRCAASLAVTLAFASFVATAGCTPILWGFSRLRVRTPPRGVAAGQTVAGSTDRPDGWTRISCSGERTEDRDTDQSWLFVPRESGEYRVRVRGAFDTAVAVYRGEDRRDEIACNDDSGDTLFSRLRVSLERDERYVIVVDGYRGEHGAYELMVERAPPDDRDIDAAASRRTEQGTAAAMAPRCAQAPVIGPGHHVGAINASVADFATSCGGNGPGGDAVFRLVVPRAGLLRVREASDFDAVLEMRAACTVGARVLACNDDAPDTRHAAFALDIQPGEYILVVDSFWERASGTFTLDVDLDAADPPRDAAAVTSDAAVPPALPSVPNGPAAAPPDASGPGR